MVGITHAGSRPAQRQAVSGFVFLDLGPLIDRELELVPLEERWVEDILISCRHPLTQAYDPESAQLTREDLLSFLKIAPAGREPADPATGRVPCYHFCMRLRSEFHPPVPIAGGIGLRVGSAMDIELYFGHVGYAVFPPARGNHYAERACRLLFDLIRRHGLNPLWITTDPSNFASRRTCQNLGGKLIEIVDIPPDNALYSRGQRRKCRYRIDV